jgi:hypothetical protein
MKGIYWERERERETWCDPVGPAIEFRWGGDIFCAIQIGLETLPISYTMATGFFSKTKRLERATNHPSASSDRLQIGWNYISS